MHDNPQREHSERDDRLGHRVVSLRGRDAVAFAQAQFMNDVAALHVGSWQWNGWLTPKGRVVALFALARIADDEVWAVLPDYDPTAFTDALRRFVFRSKVEISAPALQARAGFAPPAAASGNVVGRLDDELVEFDMGAPGMPRTLVLGPQSGAADAIPTSTTVAARTWRAADLECGLPRLSAAQSGQWTPQQLSLERLAAFSVKKGCYPGQEIVARTHFLGKAKRGLVLLASPDTIEDGAEVRGGGQVHGAVCSVAERDRGQLALAVVGLERATPADAAGDAVVSERPLRDGLAR